MEQEKRFRAWLYMVKRFGFHRKLWKEDVVLCEKSWRAYFDEGLRATEAINEDLKHV